MPITKQTIAIIGAGGNMGSAIAKSITRGNYRLLLFDRDPERLGPLTEDIQQAHPGADLEPMNCAHECGWELERRTQQHTNVIEAARKAVAGQ